jgi:tetratricopeptide (TPR) repeat protein
MADTAHAQRLLARGNAHQKRGAFYDAVRAYKAAIAADADHAPAYAAWGQALAERLRHRDAVAKYAASLQRELTPCAVSFTSSLGGLLG